MIGRLIQKLKTSCLVVFMILIPISLSFYGCSIKPKAIKIIASEPVKGTVPLCYPSIEKVYASDDEIVLVSSWGESVNPGNYTLRWEIFDNKDNRIYKSKLVNQKIKAHWTSWYKIPLDSSTKERLKSGNYIIKLFIDDQLVQSKSVQYIAKSILNKNIRGVVILPFLNKTIEVNYAGHQSPVITNTVATAIYSEVKRIVPDTVPHHVVKQKLGNKFSQNCFNEKECLNLIQANFDGEIFITGSIELKKYVGEICTLKVYVYNSNTGEKTKYEHRISLRQSYAEIINSLLTSILYKKGLLDYLKSIGKDTKFYVEPEKVTKTLSAKDAAGLPGKLAAAGIGLNVYMEGRKANVIDKLREWGYSQAEAEQGYKDHMASLGVTTETFNDLNSNDPATRQAAEQKIYSTLSANEQKTIYEAPKTTKMKNDITQNINGQIREVMRDFSADEWNKKALNLWKDGKYSDPLMALKYYSNAIKSDNKYAKAYNNRGGVYRQLGLFKLSIEDYTQAIRINPLNGEAYNNRGCVYYDLDQVNHACNDLQKACELGVCSGLNWVKEKGCCQ